MLPSSSHIVPLHIGDAALCSAVSRRLLDEFGMYATPINYPTVPRGEERLRLTPTPLHTDAMMDRLVDGAADNSASDAARRRLRPRDGDPLRAQPCFVMPVVHHQACENVNTATLPARLDKSEDNPRLQNQTRLKRCSYNNHDTCGRKFHYKEVSDTKYTHVEVEQEPLNLAKFQSIARTLPSIGR